MQKIVNRPGGYWVSSDEDSSDLGTSQALWVVNSQVPCVSLTTNDGTVEDESPTSRLLFASTQLVNNAGQKATLVSTSIACCLVLITLTVLVD